MVDQPLKTFFPFFFFFTSFNKRQRQVSFHFEGKLNPLHVYCTVVNAHRLVSSLIQNCHFDCEEWWNHILMEFISSVHIRANLRGPSHQLIKPGEFTPLAMLGPAVSPQCPSWLSVQERLPASQAQNRPGPLISARNAMNHSVEVMVQSAH